MPMSIPFQVGDVLQDDSTKKRFIFEAILNQSPSKCQAEALAPTPTPNN